MNRTKLRGVWIVSTFVIFMIYVELSKNIPETYSSLLGFLAISIIVVSVVLFKKIAGPKSVGFVSLNIKQKNQEKSSLEPTDFSVYTTNNSFTITHETAQEYAGRTGEDRIVNELSRLGSGRQIMRNLIFGQDTNTTEVDILYITECGIYVIESKNYKGWIFGNLTQQKWTQTFPNQTKNQFFNPVLQNSTHINALKHVLEKNKDINIYSVIVFSDNATLKKIPESTNDLLILNESEVNEILSASIEYNTKLKRGLSLSHSQIESIYYELYPYSIVSREEKQKHLENVVAKSISK